MVLNIIEDAPLQNEQFLVIEIACSSAAQVTLRIGYLFPKRTLELGGPRHPYPFPVAVISKLSRMAYSRFDLQLSRMERFELQGKFYIKHEESSPAYSPRTASA